MRDAMWAKACLFGALLATQAAAQPEDKKPRLVVIDLTTAGGVDPALGSAMTQAVSVAVGRGGIFNVVSTHDIEALLGVQRQKQLLGCAEESASCMSELAGALNARFVLSGTLAQLGNAFQLTLQTVDSERARPVGRAVRIAPTLKALQEQLAYLVAEATASPAPKAPSRAPAIALWVGGAALLLGGGFAGFDALSRERSLNDELARGAQMPAVLRSFGDYQTAAAQAATQKTIALCGMIAGAVALGLGFLVNPSDSGAPQLALVPSGTGFALAGLW